MGWKYEVMSWEDINSDELIGSPNYKYISYYQGEWFFIAMFWLFKLKIQGSGCVKLEWR